jgi:hypothetical protein
MQTLRISVRRRSQHGMALAVTMLLLLGVMVIGVLGMIASPGSISHNGLMTNSTSALQMSNRRLQSNTAFDMAEGGLHYTLQWLSTLPSPPSATTAFGPKFAWNTFSYNSTATTVVPDPSNPTNSFAVTMYPDANNVNNSQKCYLIESSGNCGNVTEVVQAYIKVSSLSKWLVLVNQWPSGNYWVSGLSTFDGPVHDNNANSSGNNPGTGLTENVFWKSNATTPMWSYTGSDAYQVTGNVTWYKDGWYSQGAPQTAADWATILAGGQSTFTHGAPSVNFPSSSTIQRNAALGVPATGTPTIPTASGVTVTPGGGIYIHSQNSENDSTGAVPSPNNDVQQMTLSVDGSGNQVITILQTDDNGHPMTTTVTMNTAANATQVSVSQQPPGGGTAVVSTSSVPGLGNGVVYADGNIGNQGTAPGNPTAGTAKSGGLSGTVANNVYGTGGTLTHTNSLNIVTDASKNVNIDGNLVYQTARQKDSNGNYVPESQDANFTKYAGTLGVVSNTVLITTKDANNNPLNAVEVDGAILAYTLYEVDEYNSRTPGTWENMGGYLSSNMGFFGVGDANGNLINGMNNTFNYDVRMRDTPPPYFPTTGNTYEPISWRRVGATLE